MVMKISRSKGVGNAAPAAPIAGARPSAAADHGPEKVTPADAPVDVSLSETRSLVESAKARLSQLPDVRVDRVSEIRLSVDNGSYQVQSQTVAKRIVNESLRESAHRHPRRRR